MTIRSGVLIENIFLSLENCIPYFWRLSSYIYSKNTSIKAPFFRSLSLIIKLIGLKSLKSLAFRPWREFQYAKQ
jgi:hypothetical protein